MSVVPEARQQAQWQRLHSASLRGSGRITRVCGMRSRPHAHTGFIPGPPHISPPLRCGRRRSWISLICQEPTRRRAQMSVPSVASHRRRRAAPAGRFARILRLLRWPVVIVWLVAVVALYPAAHTLSNLANGTAAANLPSSAPSTRVVELEQGPGQPDVDPATVVFVRSAGLKPPMYTGSAPPARRCGPPTGRPTSSPRTSRPRLSATASSTPTPRRCKTSATRSAGWPAAACRWP
jgi:hypothetical protein